MRVLHIIQRYPPAIGGSENWCRSLCNFAASRGILTKVATINLYNVEDFYQEPSLENNLCKLGDYDYANGVHVRRYKLWSFADRRLDVVLAKLLLFRAQLQKTQLGSIFRHSPHSFEMYFKLGRKIRDADIVHLHSVPFFHILVGFVLAKLLKKKVVITPHFHPGHVHYEKSIFYKIMDKCDAVFAVTAFEKNYLRKKGVSEEKIHITGNSIDITPQTTETDFVLFKEKTYKEHGLCDQTKKVIFIGRKEMYKGIGTLIEASKILADSQRSEVALFLVGPTSKEFTDHCRSLTRMGSLKIIDLGKVTESEKENFLKLSDVLVLPSEFEAFGIVFLEAWKHHKPVIGSDRGAIPEVIKGAGLCAEYGNAPDLSRKMSSVLFDPKFAKELGDEGRKKLVESYTPEVIAKKVLDVYHDLKASEKKVLIVSHLFPPYALGGSEIVAYQQAKMLKKSGFNVRIFCGKLDNSLPRHAILKWKKEFEGHRVILHDVDFDYDFYDFRKEKMLEGFHRIVDEFSPDIVHFHNIYSLSAEVIKVCHDMRLPTVMTLHDYWGICFKNTLITDREQICDSSGIKCENCKRELRAGREMNIDLEERNRRILKQLNRAGLLISPSKYLVERFVTRGFPKEKMRVINNGLDLARFGDIRKKPCTKIRFGYIGQIAPHKGVENIFASVSMLSGEERRKISVSLVGEGEKAFVDYCKKRLIDMSLSTTITFLGKVENSKIPRLHQSIDALLVPSIWPENSPVTIMEAFASGTPVLASNLGGIPELISDGVHGFLHSYEAPESLTANMRKIIMCPGQLVGMRQACLKRAEEYGLEKQVSMIIRCYNELIGAS